MLYLKSPAIFDPMGIHVAISPQITLFFDFVVNVVSSRAKNDNDEAEKLDRKI